MALLYNLKSMVKTTEPLIFIMGQPRDPLVRTRVHTQLQIRAQFDNIGDTVTFFIIGTDHGSYEGSYYDHPDLALPQGLPERLGGRQRL